MQMKFSTATSVAIGLLLALGLYVQSTGSDLGRMNGVSTATVVDANAAAKAASEVVVLTDKSDLKALIEDSDLPVVIDFMAEWCPPCKRMGPHVEELAKLYKGKVKVFKVDVDESPDLAAKYGIEAMPTTFVILPKGKGQWNKVGYQSLKDLKALADDVIAKSNK